MGDAPQLEAEVIRGQIAKLARPCGGMEPYRCVKGLDLGCGGVEDKAIGGEVRRLVRPCQRGTRADEQVEMVPL